MWPCLRLLEDEDRTPSISCSSGICRVDVPGTIAVARASVVIRLSPNFGGCSEPALGDTRSREREALGELRDEPALVEQGGVQGPSRELRPSVPQPPAPNSTRDRDDHASSEYRALAAAPIGRRVERGRYAPVRASEPIMRDGPAKLRRRPAAGRRRGRAVIGVAAFLFGKHHARDGAVAAAMKDRRRRRCAE